MLPFRELFDRVRDRTGMYLDQRTYSVVAAFVYGYDSACQGGPLQGFREWLIVRLGNGKYNNLSWFALVLHSAFPDAPDPQAEVHASAATETHAVDVLFRLVSEFDDLRETAGLQKIYRDYDSFLRQQDWYTPNT